MEKSGNTFISTTLWQYKKISRVCFLFLSIIIIIILKFTSLTLLTNIVEWSTNGRAAIIFSTCLRHHVGRAVSNAWVCCIHALVLCGSLMFISRTQITTFVQQCKMNTTTILYSIILDPHKFYSLSCITHLCFLPRRICFVIFLRFTTYMSIY